MIEPLNTNVTTETQIDNLEGRLYVQKEKEIPTQNKTCHYPDINAPAKNRIDFIL